MPPRLLTPLSMVALVACGDNLAAPQAIRGGTRLQLVTHVFEDGTRVPSRDLFHDAQLGERCRPHTFSDGARYCLPTAAGGQTVFTDASCTRLLGVAPPDREPPAYFIRYYQLNGQRLPSRVYRAGAPVAAPAQVWRQEDGYCLGPIVPEPLAYHALGEELTPRDLVRVRESAVVEGARVAVGIDTSEDGLHVPHATYDRLLGEPCRVIERANGEVAECIPDALPAASYYADATCTSPLLALPPGTTTDLARHQAQPSECWSLFETGAAAPISSLYEVLSGTCVAEPVPTGLAFYSPRARIEPATLARVRQPARPGARIAPVMLFDGDAALADTLYDAVLDAECVVTEVEGEPRCVPVATVTTTTVFADAQCTQPLELAFVPTGACRPPARFASSSAGLHPVLTPYTEAFYELEPGDRCGDLSAPPSTVAHAIGPAMPVESFARATIELGQR